MGVTQALQKYGPLVARILLAQLFVISGFGKITAFGNTATYMASAGMPMPEVALVLTIALELVGGILLILGWQARLIAAAFFCFTLLAALIFHQFWAADAAHASGQLINFQKNLSIAGGMLYVAVYGCGPLALVQDACAGAKGGDAAKNG